MQAFPNHILEKLRATFQPVGCFLLETSRQEKTNLLGCGKESSVTHYTVLLISKSHPADAPAQVVREISRESNGLTEVTLLVHQPKALRCSGDQKYFFHSAINRGEALCPHDLYLENIPEGRDVAATKAGWYNKEAISLLYLNAASSSPMEDVAVIKAALLHEAMRYLHLGILRVIAGYRPSNTNLRFLMDICRHLTGVSLTNHLPPADASLWKLLLRHPAQLENTQILHAPEDDFNRLLATCNAFFTHARQAALDEITRLEQSL